MYYLPIIVDSSFAKIFSLQNFVLYSITTFLSVLGHSHFKASLCTWLTPNQQRPNFGSL